MSVCRSFYFELQEDVFVVEHEDLQDGSEEPWPTEVVAQHVREFVEKSGVKTVRHCSGFHTSNH